MRSLLYILATVFATMLTISGAGLDPSGKAPIYLGMNYYPEPVKLGGSAYALPEQATELRSLIWPSSPGFNFTPNPGYALSMDSLNISEYHVPTIVDFLKEDFKPEGINYSYHVPTLGDFASPDWSPTTDIQFYHVPAITNFLKNNWQPPQPEFDHYPTWIYQYLRG
ncbi:MAG: hypothetical protein JW999_01325 [Methanotrichaceae archaeon]|nr:hypothetical protein [Methanotrichaceae archaeon]